MHVHVWYFSREGICCNMSRKRRIYKLRWVMRYSHRKSSRCLEWAPPTTIWDSAPQIASAGWWTGWVSYYYWTSLPTTSSTLPPASPALWMSGCFGYHMTRRSTVTVTVTYLQAGGRRRVEGWRPRGNNLAGNANIFGGSSPMIDVPAKC